MGFLQAVGFDASGTATTVPITSTSPVTVGSTLIFAVTYGSTTNDNTALSDTDGNSWSLGGFLHTVTDSSNAQIYFLWALEGAKSSGSNNTVTLTISPNRSFRAAVLLEYTPSHVDKNTGLNAVASGGVATGTAATPQFSGETCVGVCMNTSSTAAPTSGSGYTQRLSRTGAIIGVGAEDLTLQNPASQAITFGLTSALRCFVSLVTLSGQGPPVVVQRSAITRSSNW